MNCNISLTFFHVLYEVAVLFSIIINALYNLSSKAACLENITASCLFLNTSPYFSLRLLFTFSLPSGLFVSLSSLAVHIQPLLRRRQRRFDSDSNSLFSFCLLEQTEKNRSPTFGNFQTFFHFCES